MLGDRVISTKPITEEKETRNAKLMEILKENPEANRLWAKLEGIPEGSKYKIINFIFVEIPDTRFFHPRSPLNEEWKMFYGNSLDDARCEARRRTAGMPRDTAWCTAGGTILMLLC